VVLDEFPEWLQRSSIDCRIKDTNTKLKRIANEKKEPVSVSGQQQQEGKEEKQFREEDDLIYDPRDCNIGNKYSSIKLYLLFLLENSTSCGGQDQGRNFGHGLPLSRLSSGNYGPV
jgi:hypothetical protein